MVELLGWVTVEVADQLSSNLSTNVCFVEETCILTWSHYEIYEHCIWCTKVYFGHINVQFNMIFFSFIEDKFMQMGWFTDNILITSFIQKHKNTVTFQKPKKTLLPVIKVRERTNCLRCCVPALGWQELFLFICQECDNIPLFAFPCCFLICYIPHPSSQLLRSLDWDIKSGKSKTY